MAGTVDLDRALRGLVKTIGSCREDHSIEIRRQPGSELVGIAEIDRQRPNSVRQAKGLSLQAPRLVALSDQVGRETRSDVATTGNHDPHQVTSIPGSRATRATVFRIRWVDTTGAP